MAILPNTPEPQPPEPPPLPDETPPIKEPEPDRLPDEIPRPNPDETRDPPQRMRIEATAGKPPPTPPENQSQAGTGDKKTPKTDETEHGTHGSLDPEKQGEPANTKINTTNRRN